MATKRNRTLGVNHAKGTLMAPFKEDGKRRERNKGAIKKKSTHERPTD